LAEGDEVRANSLAKWFVVGHLQRKLPDDGRAPDFGWEVEGLLWTLGSMLGRQTNGTDSKISIGHQPLSHSYTNGASCTLHFDANKYCLYHPAAPGLGDADTAKLE